MGAEGRPGARSLTTGSTRRQRRPTRDSMPLMLVTRPEVGCSSRGRLVSGVRPLLFSMTLPVLSQL